LLSARKLAFDLEIAAPSVNEKIISDWNALFGTAFSPGRVGENRHLPLHPSAERMDDSSIPLGYGMRR
jgi:hypothetical protein